MLVLTDSRVALESLKNRKKHTYLIEKIRKKVTELERNNWKIDFSWINPLNTELNPICHLLALLGGATIVVVSRLRVKAHAGHYEN